MTALFRWTLGLLVVGSAACRDAAAPRPAASLATRLAFDQAAPGDDGLIRAAGRGVYWLAGLDVQFAFEALQPPGEAARGRFHQRLDEGGGLVIDFDAQVTCLAVDAVNHRAWIAGVVTANASTDPDYLTDINQPGRDVWFRVLDAGEAPGAIDRSTFLGFKGAAGIQTSPEYCAARLWAPGNARTWPVTSGDITVRP
jgi:hypothetical protein